MNHLIKAPQNQKKNVIIYARYSSELQNDRSIEDQVASCKAALLPDEQVKHIFEDRARSGSCMVARDGLAGLLAELEKGTCSVILAEGLDRLSRDMCDMAHIYRLATFYGVEIRTLIDGPVNKITLGFKGAMNGVQLDDLKHRTRRGQIGKIMDGKAAGGLAYGYRMRYLNDEGVPERGLREINPEQAEVVHSIYKDYATEMPVLQIVKRLNEAGIPSPRGGKWSPVTITGHYNRGDGILQNALYRGLLVWGRCPEVNHPVTNKRQMRPADAENIVSQEVPHLRIIDDDLWHKVQALRAKKHKAQKKRQSFNRFTLPCYCARCGKPMIRTEARYIICSDFKRYQTCTNQQRCKVGVIISTLFRHIEASCDDLWQEWTASLRTLEITATRQVATTKARLSVLQVETDRLITAFARSLDGAETVRQRILENEQEIEVLKQHIRKLQTCPGVSEIDKTTFKLALASINNCHQKKLFLADIIEEVTLDRDDASNLVITFIKPDFTAIAKLADKAER